ncbi:MAG: hypothetical protein AB7V48_04305 [Sedimentibacter sp.]
MTTLNRKVGDMSYDNLIAGITPPVHVSSGIIRKLAAETTLTRGTVLAKSSVDNKLVILGTAQAEAVDAIAPTYTLTEDVAITAGKTYYTKVGDVYTAVASPIVDDIGTYYEMTDPGSPAVEAEVLTADCILCDDVVVGTVADVNVTVYTAGCFNVDALTVKESYTLTVADKDKMRERGIYLATVFE